MSETERPKRTSLNRDERRAPGFKSSDPALVWAKQPGAFSLVLNDLPKILTNGGGNWRRAYFEKARWKRLVVNQLICMRLVPANPWTKAHAIFTRYSSVESDFDNLVASFKACRDALTEAGAIADDSPKHFTAEYRWIKAKPKQGKIKIEAWEVKL